MDPISNPYTPGAGIQPPALVGRDALLKDAHIVLERVRRGRPERSLVMLGLRGVGKTVLLQQIFREAEQAGIQALYLEADEHRALPAMLASHLRSVLLKLSRNEKAAELARRGLRALAGFVGTLKIRLGDIAVGIDLDPEPGLADSGDLDTDLPALLRAAGEAAQQAQTALVLFIDELQSVSQSQLGALIFALHSASQRQLPVILIGAGLPQLRGVMGKAKSYSERLIEFAEVGSLNARAARQVVEKPAKSEGVEFEARALKDIVTATEGYPYFLQQWGKCAWDAAEKSPITREDVARGAEIAIHGLDASFFSVRFERLTPREQRYLRAMAELGAGPHRSGAIAKAMGRKVSAMAPARETLIKKGMVWSPAHGHTAFTVPLFDRFLRRVMPDWKRAD